MVSLGTAVLDLVGDLDSLDRDLNTAKKKVQDFGKKSKELGMNLAAVTAPIIGSGGAALKLFADFEQQMARVGAVSGASGGELADLTAKAKEMGETTVFTASQAADAMGFMAMAGMNTSDIMTALPSVLQLASAAQIDLATAADLVTNTMAGYGISADQLDRVNDVMVTGFTKANTDLTQLGQAFKFAGPVAKAAGLEFEETTAILAILGNAGIQSTQAGTALRRMISRLAKPTGAAADAIEELGIVTHNSDGSMKSMTDIIEQFQQSSITTEQAVAIFGQQGLGPLFALMEQGAPAIRELQNEMLRTGVAADISAAQLDTTQGKMTLLKSAAEGAMLTLGEALAPILLDLMQKLMPLISGFTEWVKEHETLAKVVFAGAAVLGVFAIGLIAIGFIVPLIAAGFTALSAAATILGGALTFALGPVGLIILAIAALIVVGILVWKNWDTIKAKALQIWGAIKAWFIKTLDSIKDKFTSAWETVKTFLQGVWNWLVDLFKNNWDKILAILFPPVGIAILIGRNWGAIKGVIHDIWEAVKRTVVNAINFIIDKINNFINTVNRIKIRIPTVKIPFDGTVGGGSVGFPQIPTIPRLATGGIAIDSTLALIGEGGMEAVIPLDRLDSMLNGGRGGPNIVNHFHEPVYGDVEDKIADTLFSFDRRGREVIFR